MQRVAGLDPVQWLPQLKTQRIRIQQVMDDMATPKTAKERIDSAAPANATILRYEDDRGLFNAASGGRIFEWVKSQLRPDAALPPAAAILQKSPSTVRPTEPGHDN